MERFQWLTTEEAQEAITDPQERDAVPDESADILIYCLSLSNALKLDISSAVLGKRGPERSVRRTSIAILWTRLRRELSRAFRGSFRRQEREESPDD
jgi:hypothetical protein